MRKKKKKGEKCKRRYVIYWNCRQTCPVGLNCRCRISFFPPVTPDLLQTTSTIKKNGATERTSQGWFFSLNWSGCDGPLTLSFFPPVDTISFLRRFENENIKVNLLSRPSPHDETLASCTSTHIATCRWLYTILTFLQNKSYHVYVTYLRQDFH